MNNKKYIEMLRKDPEIQRIMMHRDKDYDQLDHKDPRHVSAQDVVAGVFDADQNIGDGRIFNYYLSNGGYIEDIGEFYSISCDFDETILNPDWEPNKDWLTQKDYSNEEYVF